MGWYNVVKPCVVGQLHYARPTVQPITVDDEVAAPLVEDGSLAPYPAAESESAEDRDRRIGDSALRHFSPEAADAVQEHREATQRTRRPRSKAAED